MEEISLLHVCFLHVLFASVRQRAWGLYLTRECLVQPFSVESAVSDGRTVMWDGSELLPRFIPYTYQTTCSRAARSFHLSSPLLSSSSCEEDIQSKEKSKKHSLGGDGDNEVGKFNFIILLSTQWNFDWSLHTHRTRW